MNMNNHEETQSFESFLRSSEGKNPPQNDKIGSSGSSINNFIDKNKSDLFNYNRSSNRGSINNQGGTFGLNHRNFGGSNQNLRESISKGFPMKSSGQQALSEASSDPLLSNYGGGISSYNRARQAQNANSDMMTLPVPIGQHIMSGNPQYHQSRRKESITQPHSNEESNNNGYASYGSSGSQQHVQDRTGSMYAGEANRRLPIKGQQL